MQQFCPIFRISTSRSGPLVIFTTSAVTSCTEVLSPSKTSVMFGINVFQTPVNIDRLTSSHEPQKSLMPSGMVNPSQRCSIYFAHMHVKNPYEQQKQLNKSFFLNNKIEIQNYSLIHHGLQNGGCVSWHENNISFIVHPHRSSGMTRCIADELKYCERNLFSRAVCLTSGLKYSVNHVINSCAVI